MCIVLANMGRMARACGPIQVRDDMKKCAMLLLACLSVVGAAFAADAETKTPKVDLIAPVDLSVTGDSEVDVVGLRLGIWAECRQFTGLDLNIGGTAADAYGLQIALIRNEVRDKAGAIQIAIGQNKTSDMRGLQLALWNEATLLSGLQIGLLNTANDVRGLQIGLINATDTMYGYQFGLINVIRSAPYLPFTVLFNTVLSED